MLKVTIFEFIFRLIPEEFILIFAINLFSLKNINSKRIFISSFIMSIIVFLVRLLPIEPGIHTLILILIFALVSVGINKIPLKRSVAASILSTIILLVCEIINVYILTDIFKIDMERAFQNPVLKTYYGLISLGLYAIICLIVYLTFYRKRKKI